MKTTIKLMLLSMATLAMSASAYASSEVVGKWNLKIQPGSLVRSTSMIGLRNGLTEGNVTLYKNGDGLYSLRMEGTTVDECMNVEIPVDVTKTPETTTIALSKRFPSCQMIRLEISNDGSGGTVQQNVGRRGKVVWETDEDHSYDLTPR